MGGCPWDVAHGTSPPCQGDTEMAVQLVDGVASTSQESWADATSTPSFLCHVGGLILSRGP